MIVVGAPPKCFSGGPQVDTPPWMVLRPRADSAVRAISPAFTPCIRRRVATFIAMQ